MPKEVIDQAIQDNRVPMVILYVFACMFVISGVLLITPSIWNRMPLAAVSGAALNGLTWPAVGVTRVLRQQNPMLQMLESLLTKARTEEEAAKMLGTAFGSHFQTHTSNTTGLAQQVER